MRAVQQLLTRLTAVAISSRNNVVDLTGINPVHVAQLREQGYLDPIRNELTPKATLLYFDKCPLIKCPPEVQQWVDRICSTDPIWRLPFAALIEPFKLDDGFAYAYLNTIFVQPHARLVTYWHELGHIVYPKIPPHLVIRLEREARSNYPVRANTDITAALDKTLKPVNLPPGNYMPLRRMWCPLGPSEADEDAQRNEIWAIFFAEYCLSQHSVGVTLFESIQTIIEEIISFLESSVCNLAADPASISAGSAA